MTILIDEMVLIIHLFYDLLLIQLTLTLSTQAAAALMARLS